MRILNLLLLIFLKGSLTRMIIKIKAAEKISRQPIDFRMKS